MQGEITFILHFCDETKKFQKPLYKVRLKLYNTNCLVVMIFMYLFTGRFFPNFQMVIFYRSVMLFDCMFFKFFLERKVYAKKS